MTDKIYFHECKFEDGSTDLLIGTEKSVNAMLKDSVVNFELVTLYQVISFDRFETIYYRKIVIV